MKITKTRLLQIIKEEVQNHVAKNPSDGSYNFNESDLMEFLKEDGIEEMDGGEKIINQEIAADKKAGNISETPKTPTKEDAIYKKDSGKMIPNQKKN